MAMTQPLAFVLYESLLPGSQLANRMRDLGYRVSTVPDAMQLVAQAEAEKPMVLVTELFNSGVDICTLLRELKQNPGTSHIPVLAYFSVKNKDLQNSAVQAGANLVAGDAALLGQLPRLLEQVLEVE
ncbi:MAG TPA: response regulator [Verrucomicrobiae bacterium]